MKKKQKNENTPLEGDTVLSDTDAVFADDGGSVVDDSDTFKLKEQTDEKATKKKSGLKKRLLITLIVIGVLAVATVVVYLAVIKPIYDEKKENENTEEPEPMIDGEVRDSGGYKILLYEYTNKASTNRITVENPNGGSFNLVRDENGDFYVKEHGKGKPVSATTVNNLVSAAGNPVITSRILDKCDDLSLYGLAEADSPIKVTIENTDGKENSFYIGNLIVSEGGYYCRAEGRSAVYILSLSDLSALLVSSDNLIEPILGPVFDENTAQTMTHFGIYKNGQIFLSIDYVETENTDEVRNTAYKMTYPAEYLVSQKYGTDVLTKIADAEGYTVVKAGDGTTNGRLYKHPEIMAEFGFVDMNNPLYTVYYSYEDKENDNELAGRIIFAESGSDVYYYAYSYTWDTIVLIEKSEVDFLEWDLIEYVNEAIFYEYIQNVSKLSVKGSVKYYKKVYNVNESFTYGYVGEDSTLHCKAESTGAEYTGEGLEKNYVQAFYHSALYLKVEGYLSELGITPSTNELYATFTIEFSDGREKQEYRFYKITDAYCYFTVNNEAGDFYVSTTNVNRLMINAMRASNGCEIDSSLEFPSPPDSFKNRLDGEAWVIEDENA